jgi:hypothetical protein
MSHKGVKANNASIVLSGEHQDINESISLTSAAYCFYFLDFDFTLFIGFQNTINQGRSIGRKRNWVITKVFLSSCAILARALAHHAFHHYN